MQNYIENARIYALIKILDISYIKVNLRILQKTWLFLQKINIGGFIGNPPNIAISLATCLPQRLSAGVP